MFKFKSIYKSEYNKILNSYDEKEHLKDDKDYIFSSSVNREITRIKATF